MIEPQAVLSLGIMSNCIGDRIDSAMAGRRGICTGWDLFLLTGLL